MCIAGPSQLQPHFMEALVLHSGTDSLSLADDYISTLSTTGAKKLIEGEGDAVSCSPRPLANLLQPTIPWASSELRELAQEAARESCALSNSSSNEEGSFQEPQRLKDRRARNLKRKTKTRRSQSISFCQSRRDFRRSILLPDNVAVADFHAVTDHEINCLILKQGLSSCLSTIAVVLAVSFCMMILAVPFTGLKPSDAVELQVVNLETTVEPLGTCLNYPCGNQFLGALGVSLCLAGGLLLRDRRCWKWGNGCRRCNDVVERTRDLTEEAEHKAHKAQRAKQQFMAYVFHNIRVPFNAIVLGLGHLRTTVGNETSSNEVREKGDLVQMMLDCAETMTGVLDDATDMGQWEDGAMELQLEEFDLLAVVKFLSWGLKDLLYQKQICFNMTVDPVARKVLTFNHVVGDKHRVLQTLGNFLSNAVKFTPAGGRLELSIRCEEVLSTNPGDSSIQSGVQERTQLQDCSLCSSLGVEGLSKSTRPNLDSHLSSPWCEQSNVAQLLMSVKDTGIGISSEDQAKLFEPYSFVTSGWVQKAGVSGLGLSMAKRFAEQSGGYIGVQSEEGEGSTFYFAIPYPLVPVKHMVEYKLPSKELHFDGCMRDSQLVSKIQDDVVPSRGSEPKILQEQNFNLAMSPLSQKSNSRRRVLLVEDTEINRIILRKVLQNLNLHCEEAENGQVAIDFMKQGRTYDLILMDKEMPVMDGHEATRQLRMMGVKTPIVALTGNSLQSDRELFLEAGVDDFQTKPLSRDKLVQLLARFGVEISYAESRG